jgi:phage terminase large subunit-like protein
MKKYAKIQSSGKTVSFNLYPFQEDTLKAFSEYDNNIILKSRQMGLSTLVAIFSLWNLIFKSDQNILIISLKQDAAIEVLEKVSFANEALPSWMKVATVENNKKSIKFVNGSSIKASSTTKKSGVGKSLAILIIDECISGNSIIDLRNKITGEIQKVKIKDLYELEEYS